MRACLITFGCQMNDYDSARMAGLLESAGYELVPEENLAQADVVLINTCSVRESAEQRVYGRVWQMKPIKEKKSRFIIGICGCMAEKHGARLVEKVPIIDLIVGPRQEHRIVELLEEVVNHTDSVPKIAIGKDEQLPSYENVPIKRELTGSRVSAYVSIIEGCSNFCAYCVVPYTRGPAISRPVKAIIREIEELAQSGYKEVTLIGQNVNAYKWHEVNFAKLLQLVHEVEGIIRIRFTTSHPRDMTEEIIDTIAQLPKICEHFHLPMQAGSNRILQLMNRGYTREQYFRLVDLIRNKFPQASITTDLIVGFPGETEEDFLETIDAVKRVQWDSAFTFMYSPREGTAAFHMPSQVPLHIRQRRIKELISLQKQISLSKLKTYIGKEVEILVEGPSKTNQAKWFGRTRTNIITVFSPDENIKIGELRKVLIEDASAYTLFGKVC